MLRCFPFDRPMEAIEVLANQRPFGVGGAEAPFLQWTIERPLRLWPIKDLLLLRALRHLFLQWVDERSLRL